MKNILTTFRTKFFRRGMLGIGVLVYLSMSYAMQMTAAAADVWGGRSAYHGYYYNNDANSDSPYKCAGHVSSGPVIDNDCYANLSIPGSTKTADQVYSFLYNKYNSPGTYGHADWDKTGASFIANTMMGRVAGGAGASKSMDAGDWAKLKGDLDNPALKISKEDITSGEYGNRDTYYQYGEKDVAYYNNDESGWALVFRVGGAVKYVLLYKCANPVGNFPGLPPYDGGGGGGTIPTPPTWSVTPATTVSINTATSTVTWNHAIKNDGPDATDQAVVYRYENDGDLGSAVGGGHTLASGTASGGGGSFTSTQGYGPDDAGRVFCRLTSAAPESSDSTDRTYSDDACVTIPYNYALTPTVTISGGTSFSAQPGQTGIAVASSIYNSGPTRSQPTDYTLTRCTYPNATSAPHQTSYTDNGGSAQATFGGSCTAVTGGSGNDQTYGASTTSGGPGTTENDTDVPAGTRICYILGVNPPSSSLTGWRYSVPACIVVLKFPKVQALGGDVKAGSVSTHAPVLINGKSYGSWSQYGIFGVAGISGMGSAGSLAGGATSTGPYNGLTFANTSTTGGTFYSTAPSVDYYQNYSQKADSSTGTTSVGGAIGQGTSQVVWVKGNLTITSNWTYPENYTSIDQIPHVIYVVQGNIYVDPSVTKIDPWLIGQGSSTLFTCSTFTSTAYKLTTNDCKNQLTFNGPVTIGNTLLGRTFGADGDSLDQAAEVFNLSPSNYLSNYDASVSASNIQTVYEKELPPRW